MHFRFLVQTIVPGHFCMYVVTDLQLNILLYLLQICPILIKSVVVTKPVSKDKILPFSESATQQHASIHLLEKKGLK